jgi:hypothetical protein
MVILDEDHKANLQNGVIERPKEAGAFCSPKFVARDPQSRHRPRVVYNTQFPNRWLQVLQQPYPTIPGIIGEISSAKYFSKLDLKAGYHQVPLHENSRHLTRYNHRGEAWQFTRLQMGLASAPSIFQHTMTSVFAEHLPYTKIYLDDILVYSDTLEEHLQHMAGILRTCEEFNIHLSEGKCEFAVQTVTFLGYRIANGEISHPRSYIEPIVCQPLPNNVSALRSFIGQVNFIGSHLKDMQLLLQPLHNLISDVHKVDQRKKAPIRWSPELRQRFMDIQSYTRDNYTPLMLPDISRPFEIYTDASRTGCGAVLLQRHE